MRLGRSLEYQKAVEYFKETGEWFEERKQRQSIRMKKYYQERRAS